MFANIKAKQATGPFAVLHKLNSFIEHLIADFIDEIPDFVDGWKESYAKPESMLDKETRHERFLKSVLRRDRMIFGKTDRYTAMTMLSLAGFYRGQKRYSEADSLYQRACDILELAYLKEPEYAKKNFLEALKKTGEFSLEYAKYEQARLCFKTYLQESGDLLLAEEKAEICFRLASLAEKLELSSEMSGFLAEELALSEELFGPCHSALASVLMRQASMHRSFSQNELLAAKQKQMNLIESICILEKALGKDSPSLLPDLDELERLYRKAGKHSLCSILSERIKMLTLIKQVEKPANPRRFKDMLELAAAYRKRAEPGDESLALRLERKVASEKQKAACRY